MWCYYSVLLAREKRDQVAWWFFPQFIDFKFTQTNQQGMQNVLYEETGVLQSDGRQRNLIVPRFRHFESHGVPCLTDSVKIMSADLTVHR